MLTSFFFPSRLPIRLLAVMKCYHVNHFLLFTNFIKESPIPDSVTPRLWLPVLQFSDVCAIIGFGLKLRVHIREQLFSDVSDTSFADLFNMTREILGLKNPVFRRQTFPFSPWLPWILDEAY